MTPKVSKHTKMHGTHAAGLPEVSPTAARTAAHIAAHTAARGVEVAVSPGPDLLVALTAGHPPAADRTLKSPRKQLATRIIH